MAAATTASRQEVLVDLAAFLEGALAAMAVTPEAPAAMAATPGTLAVRADTLPVPAAGTAPTTQTLLGARSAGKRRGKTRS